MKLYKVNQQSRLFGIELFRSIAIFAVVILHSDEGANLDSTSWQTITHFATFSVPFFLATSFYFAVTKLHQSANNYSLKGRFSRLLIPYLFWSFFYLSYKALKYSIDGNYEQLQNLYRLLQQPVNLVLGGHAAIHLYFLPLLITGLIMVKLIEPWLKKKISLLVLLMIWFGACLLYKGLFILNHQLQKHVVLTNPQQTQVLTSILESLINILLIESGWIIICLPYILLAVILTDFRIKNWLFNPSKSYLIFVFSLFIITNIFMFGDSLIISDLSALPHSDLGTFSQVLRGYLALVLAISLSSRLKENPIIVNLGLCSFGIYLIHLLVIEGFLILEKRVYPGDWRTATPNMIAIAILSFFISWFIVLIFRRNKYLGRLLFG